MEVEFLDIGKGKIAFEDTKKDGPLTICLPGIGDLRSEYRFLEPELTKAGYRVVTVDLRGQGDSSAWWPNYNIQVMANDLTDLVDYLDAGPAYLVGTGMSGAVVSIVASETPSKVAGLVLISAFIRDVPVSGGQRLNHKFLTMRPWGSNRWGNHYRGLYRAQKPADLEDHINQLKKTMRQKNRLYALKRLLQTTKEIGEPRMSQIEAPAMVITGSQDPEFPDPTWEGRYIAHCLGGVSEVLSIEGAGHYPHVEMPDQVNPAIAKFLTKAREFYKVTT